MRNKDNREASQFELPELVVLAAQINATLTGKVIKRGSLGNSPHKFVWRPAPIGGSFGQSGPLVLQYDV